MAHNENYGGQFDPHLRCRSNTWSAPPEYYAGEKEQQVSASVLPKKSNSRRNAWGNMSYADLITKAIEDSKEKRLTLSQIYDWMVHNVTYFKDKGDNNSSAGWKNSIRHNLSLHNRFMRVQNEGTGKSSWWMINPDAKPGKSPRRRTTNVQGNKYERKRGRVKKKPLEQQRRNSAVPTPSPSSSMSENADSPINLAHQVCSDYRARSNMSATSHLSPIDNSNGTWTVFNADCLPPNVAEQGVLPCPYFNNCVVKDIKGQGYPYAEPYRHYPTPPRGSPHLVFDNPMTPHQHFYPLYSSSQVDSHSTSPSIIAGHMVNHLMPINSPTDADLNYVSVQGGLECDVDQVIINELNYDGVLDFSGDTSSSNAPPQYQRSWVH